MNTLSIDTDNCISIPIYHLNNWSVSFISKDYEKDIRDVVNMLKHLFEMYDKNLKNPSLI